MIGGFEARLAELITDRLAEVPELSVVARPGAPMPAPVADTGRVVVAVVQTAPLGDVADAGREVFRAGSTLATRPLLRLHGMVALAVETTDAAGVLGTRGVLFRLVDALLLSLDDPEVRAGAAFATDEDLGFALDRFQLSDVAFQDPSGGTQRAVVRYAFTGRFWPVEPAQAAGAIRSLPVRVVVLPAGLPERLRARAGGAPLRIPVTLDLRTLEVGDGSGAAAPRLVARLLGASPPGALEEGEVTDAGRAYAPDLGDAAGAFTVVYRPPAVVAGTARVRVGLGLAHGPRRTIAVGELAIEVGA